MVTVLHFYNPFYESQIEFLRKEFTKKKKGANDFFIAVILTVTFC